MNKKAALYAALSTALVFTVGLLTIQTLLEALGIGYIIHAEFFPFTVPIAFIVFYLALKEKV